MTGKQNNAQLSILNCETHLFLLRSGHNGTRPVVQLLVTVQVMCDLCLGVFSFVRMLQSASLATWACLRALVQNEAAFSVSH